MNKIEPNFDLQTELEICKKYTDGLSTIKLAIEYRCKWDATINRILKKHNCSKRDRSHQRRIYEINEIFFNKINTEEKAYILGLLYADGGAVGNNVCLALKSTDYKLLEEINRIIGSNKPLRNYINNSQCQYSKLEITNKKIAQQLKTLGIVERKTHKIRFPNWLKSHLTRHFIRGYFDGDGGLTVQKARNKAQITITSNINFCQDLKKEIENQIDIHCLILAVRGKNINRLVVSGNKQILKFCDWIYENASLYLSRKYDRYKLLQANPVSRSKPQQTS